MVVVAAAAVVVVVVVCAYEPAICLQCFDTVS